MSDDPFAGYGLLPVTLADRNQFQPYFSQLTAPLSDYTFGQIYTWQNSLHIMWKVLGGHLCVFANGAGDLTLLMPPIGDGNGDAAMRLAVELMDDYNRLHDVPDRTRVEYVSEELLGRFDRGGFDQIPMGADYIYDTARMIDLAGGDLASKRQARNRFQRTYTHRVETYDAARHYQDCVAMLSKWRVHQDAQHLEEPNCQTIKRQKETIATELALRSAAELGLKGMVVYAAEPAEVEPTVRGFTLGEYLSVDQSSIVIEKTDLETRGMAQFIFSEFCRVDWSDRPQTNVGDDWGLPTLAWTKMSYRPVRMMQKFALCKSPSILSGYEPATIPQTPARSVEPQIRTALKSDLVGTIRLEQQCFRAEVGLKKRQLQYLQQRSTAVFLVAEDEGEIIGEGIALVRQHKRTISGRIYSLAVDQRHRGRHLGRKLLDSMVIQLSGRGVTRIYLEVEQGNDPAIALYAGSGFRSVGKLPDYYGIDRDGLHMVRDVEPIKMAG